jgi:uncharacterized protein (TIGR02246 family)
MKLELKQIEQQRHVWLDAVNKNDIEGMKTVFSDDAVWIPSGLPALNGKNAIAEWMSPFFETYDYEFSIRDLNIKGAGDWAVEQASFTSKLSPKGEEGEGTTHDGKYIIIWRWEKDNKWRIERYLDNSDKT